MIRLTLCGRGPYARSSLSCGSRATARPVANRPPADRDRDSFTWLDLVDRLRLTGVTAVSKRTFQPNNRRRAKTHGFRLRMRTRAGRAIISARRRKGRSELSA